MSEPRIVSPEEARAALDEAARIRQAQGSTVAYYGREERALYTVATEPDRTRAAVVKALTRLADGTAAVKKPRETQPIRDEVVVWLRREATAIENGAPL